MSRSVIECEGGHSFGPAQLAQKLERGKIVSFPNCPFPLPDLDLLSKLRAELPLSLKVKNVSYHPEADRLVGVSGNSRLEELAKQVLVEHSNRVENFIRGALGEFTNNWVVGTSSFRPIEERGRCLGNHASNELIHVDAGAYGATNGSRILRFFVNVNPLDDRVWATKGSFADLFARHHTAAGMDELLGSSRDLEKGPLNRARSSILAGLARMGVSMARSLDSSPYDRAMRRFHNYMKDDAEFKASAAGYEEMRFAPWTAWMALTDTASHACISGRHALVNTFLIPLENCREPEFAPMEILRKFAAFQSAGPLD